MDRYKINEIIVVEGRDDTCAIRAAIDAETIETHGFGIRDATWNLIEKAYNTNGIIIFTDPDYSGEEIRRRLLARFPKAKEAFLSRAEATAGNDIGIENATPESIRIAISKVCTTTPNGGNDVFCMDMMQQYGLTGGPESKKLREKMGRILGIGYGNGQAFLRKLNKYGITVDAFEEAYREAIDD